MPEIATRTPGVERPPVVSTSSEPLDVETTTNSRGGLVQALSRSFANFLVLPLGILVAFLIAAMVVVALDKANPSWLQPLRNWLMNTVFPESLTTGSFLGTVAGGVLTQTSIVISMLLIVLQNTASNMGNLVYDQFMRRRRNQVYVGYVIGSVVLALFLQSTVSESFNPVLGGTLVLVVMFFSMVLLVWFLYSMMSQMKPEVIVNDIHNAAMGARKNELRTLMRTRQKSISAADVQVLLRSTVQGYVTNISLDRMDECLEDRDPATEVVIRAIVGDFVSYHDVIAEIRSPGLAEAQAVATCTGEAFTLEREREPTHDLRFNLEQFEMIAWTEGSSAKHNPETPLRIVHSLRDLLRRWILQDLEPQDVKERIAVVYPDRAISTTLDALESIAVVSTESQQHQVFAEVLDALALTYRDLPPDLRARVDTLLYRTVPGLSQLLYTVTLEKALDSMVSTLRDVGNDETAGMLAQARNQLASSVGRVSSADGANSSGCGTDAV